jgi:AcrR family transcriptional regulator
VAILEIRSLWQRVILENTLKELFSSNYEAVTIEDVCEKYGLAKKKAFEYFADDDDLKMSAVEYAASVWVTNLSKRLNVIASSEERIRLIIRSFALGTEEYPQSLSIYIDLWKRLRDCPFENSKIKDRLNRVYKFYSDEFCRLLSAEWKIELEDESLRSIAYIFVVISDGLHIQTFLQQKELDCDKITETLCRMLSAAKVLC